MNSTVRALVAGSLLLIAPVMASAQDMAVDSVAATGSVGSGVVISATPLHAMGPTAVSVVAFEVMNEDGAWSLPPANDAGESGDALAGDGQWSLSADMSGAAPGDYSLVVYVVDTAGSEFVSEPFQITLN